MITIHKIKKAVANIDRGEVMADRKERLCVIVNQYGVECVAAATGLNVTTINQYLRSNFSSIGLEPLTQAEKIFAKLSR